ncbi:SDR family oxidoreductase [Streptomyces europaeiscabiei]|uniref:SDR family oxidoreductase n=1 Tax=Streptomyces europaeiscabiei TaxID=146819 RepID=UPI0038F79F52
MADVCCCSIVRHPPTTHTQSSPLRPGGGPECRGRSRDRPLGITAHSVGPGFTDTGPTRAALADPAVRARAEAVSVLKRAGTASDVADVVAFLASPDSRWITGRHPDATGGSLLSPH